MFFILIIIQIFKFSLLSSIDNNFYPKEKFINYDRVAEKDRILIERNLPRLFCNQVLRIEISPLSGGKSGDSLYVGKFEKSKFVIRIVAKANSKNFIKQLSYSQIAAQNQMGPSVLYYNVEDGILITEFIEGTPLFPRLLDNESILLKLSCALHHIHHSQTFIEDKYDVFKQTETELKNLIRKNKGSYRFLEKYLNHIKDINFAIKSRKLIAMPCHNDIHMANVFYDLNQNIKFIDWGDAGLGDPFFDLARASIEFHFSKDQTEKFLSNYFCGNISLVDRAHFVLMQQLALLKIGLYFVEISYLDETTKDSVVSYFKKNEIEISVDSINSPQDVAKIIFKRFEQKMLSEETKQALLVLKDL